MRSPRLRSRPTRSFPWTIGVFVGAALVALASARDFAGGWNDGSRLATVECLVDYGTLRIDRSIFVKVPRPRLSGVRCPYPPDDALLVDRGTADKLFIDGHYYSDKSPVPALFMAGLYAGLKSLTGLKARAAPDRFCFWMTLGTSGLAYVLAVVAVYRLGVVTGLSVRGRLALTASFALATIALPYARHVNNHILLLAVAAWIMVEWALLRVELTAAAGAGPWRRLFGVGALAGMGYTIDLGAGPVLLVSAFGVIVFRLGQRHAPAGRRVRFAALGAGTFLLGAGPWLALHHVMNYHIGGTWVPANAVPEYFRWPGCPFDTANMTGTWHERGPGALALYAAGLLVGKKGFLGHNPVLLLAVLGGASLLGRRSAERPEIAAGALWSMATWLVYAVASTGSSGLCCSVRWFVPLLAPAFYVLAVLLRREPWRWGGFRILSAGGAVLAFLMWQRGTWMGHMVPFYWPILGVTIAGWLGYSYWDRSGNAMRTRRASRDYSQAA